MALGTKGWLGHPLGTSGMALLGTFGAQGVGRATPSGQGQGWLGHPLGTLGIAPLGFI
jgi:hypothetical protein